MTDLALRQAERDQDWERYSRLLDRAGYLRYEWFCGPLRRGWTAIGTGTCIEIQNILPVVKPACGSLIQDLAW